MPRRSYRCTWDDIAFLHADHMAGWGAFEPGCQETVHFDTDGLPRMAFEMEVETAFRVAYRWQAFGQEPTGDVLTSRICIERRACRFGGSRAYFSSARIACAARYVSPFSPRGSAAAPAGA